MANVYCVGHVTWANWDDFWSEWPSSWPEGGSQPSPVYQFRIEGPAGASYGVYWAPAGDACPSSGYTKTAVIMSVADYDALREGGGGMDQVVFAILMVIFVLGLFWGFKWAEPRSVYRGE